MCSQCSSLVLSLALCVYICMYVIKYSCVFVWHARAPHAKIMSNPWQKKKDGTKPFRIIFINNNPKNSMNHRKLCRDSCSLNDFWPCSRIQQKFHTKYLASTFAHIVNANTNTYTLLQAWMKSFVLQFAYIFDWNITERLIVEYFWIKCAMDINNWWKRKKLTKKNLIHKSYVVWDHFKRRPLQQRTRCLVFAFHL